MDPTEKGWFNKFLELRKPKQNIEKKSQLFYYNYLKDTGLMYGHPLNLPLEIRVDTSKFPVKERMKLVFTESLISAILTFAEDKVDQIQDELFFEKKITEFYNQNPDKTTAFVLSNLFRNNTTGIKNAEKWLNDRIVVKNKWKGHFWNMFFYNVLLYADTLQFIEWLNKPQQKVYNFTAEKKNIRMTALQIIAAASNCNHRMDKEEIRFYGFFLESAELSKDDLKKAQNFLKDIKTVNQIEFAKDASWLKRKYFLDLAILSLWADKTIAEHEMIFLENLRVLLNLEEDELNGSLVAIESFVLQNWERIHFLQSKQPYYVLSQRLVERLTSISLKYKNQLANEISESKDLVELLGKSTYSDLSVEEKERMRLQLIDILKSLPAVAYMCLPFTFFTLPILFKIIPKSVFPSSFDENRLMEKKNRKIVE